jgi:hypothetical protein
MDRRSSTTSSSTTWNPTTPGAQSLLLLPHRSSAGTPRPSNCGTFYGITENVHVVSDGERLCLGEHSLRFVATALRSLARDDETMRKPAHLVSCDGFGGYGALNGRIFDDDILPLDWYEAQSLPISSTLSPPLANRSATPSQAGRAPPGHRGPLSRPGVAQTPPAHHRPVPPVAPTPPPGDLSVTLIYASKYGNTEKMMEVIARASSTRVP